MSRPLTESALKNLESGAVTGAGTSTCRRCEGDKEIARLNSNTCRACGGKAAVKDEDTERLVMLRTWVTPAVRYKIYALADKQGVSSSAMLRDILTAHTETEAAEDRSIPDRYTWESCKAWIASVDGRYEMACETADMDDPASVYTWALQNGFKP